MKLILLFALGISASPAAVPTKEQLDFFESKVRPVLAENCYKCHSVEKGKAKGGLTLDTRDGVLKGGDDGAAIKAGDPAASRLIQAVNYADPDTAMPPKNGGGKLPDKDIAALTEWVKMGAPDSRLAPANGKIVGKLSGLNDNAKLHWAYQPLAEFSVPEVKLKEWVRNPIDAFVLSKLEAVRMTPNPPATREALIRRVSYDLTGLPPSPQEVAAFVNDRAPDAWERVVDRLLASPHYGERWGRHWLDTARYSDTTGGDKKVAEDYRYAHAWTYRDYVIQAFNDDKPYRDFVIEQLAADRISNIEENDPRLAALGFITVGQRFKNTNDEINDRIDVVSKGFLGLTVTCARCHDHMFDPIPTEDYYALHGIFASTFEPKEKPFVGTPVDAEKFRDFATKEAMFEHQNRDTYYRLVGRYMSDFRSHAAYYLLVTLWGNGQKLSRDELAERNDFMRERGLDEDIVKYLLGRVKNTRDPVFGLWAQFLDLPTDGYAERAQKIIADLSMSAAPHERRPVNPLLLNLFKSSPTPHNADDVAAIYGKLFTAIEPHAKAFMEQAAKANEPAAATAGIQPEVIQLLEFPVRVIPNSELDAAAIRDAIQRFPDRKMAMKGMQQFAFNDMNTLELTHPGAPARAMVVNDMPTPRSSPVFIRGQSENKGDTVPRHFLEILTYGGKPQPFKEGSGRLELAQCIAAHPLTARVAVNRVWMHHFGDGFVPTPDDLGMQSEKPSHPELLEWLAARFMQTGGSMKRLHRLILTSNTYQQSAATHPEYELRDPQNRLLWRANIRRLDFESVRDSLLSFSGKLDPQIGGKPINLTDEPYSFRRSVYGYIDRGGLPELMTQFDFSNPDMPNSKRSTSIVPQQALFLMNSPMAVDVARKVTQRPEFTEAKDDPSRIRALYAILFQRIPRAEELELAKRFLAENSVFISGSTEVAALDSKQAQMRAMKKANGKNANKTTIKNEGEIVERKPLTAWELYTHTLLFTNEMAYVN